MEKREYTIDQELKPLFQAMKEARERMLTSTTLDTLERGELSKKDWVTFATQRYLAALNFEKLLVAGIAQAEPGSPLAKALQSNLNDETGVDTKGEYHEKQSHALWRKNFYDAIGANDEAINTSQALDGTKAYSEEIDALSHDNLLKIAGALLVLEFTIPYEFKKIQAGRDITFKDTFVEQPNDDKETKDTKAKARLYIDDHIIHDARSHYPDLLNALQPHLSNPDDFAKIKEGIDRVAAAKQKFYESLDSEIK